MTSEEVVESATWSSKRIAGAVAVGGVLLLAFALPLHFELRLPVFPQDEGLLLVYPSEILRGGVPNHTFDSVYGATNLWIIASAFKVAGHSLVVERSVGILYRFAIVSSLAVLGWRRRGPIASLAAGAMAIVLLTGSLGVAAYSWFAALAFGAVALVLVDVAVANEPRRWPFIAGGIGFGLAIGCRIDMALAIALVMLVLLFKRRDCVPWLTVGLAIGLIPLLVNIVQAGPAAVVRDQVLQPIFVSGPSRRLPLTTLTWEEIVLLFLCVAVAVASTLLGALRARSDGGQWDSVFLLLLGVFELGILPQAFQRSDSLHLTLVACFILPAVVMFPAWRIRWGAERATSLNLVPIAIGVVVLLLAAPYYGHIYWTASGHVSGSNGITLAASGRSVIVGTESDAQDLGALLRTLERRSTVGQRLFVGPMDLRTANYNDTFIYFLVPGLHPGSYYLEMNPGVSNGDHSQLSRDLRTNDFLILSSRYDQPGSGPLGPDLPNQIVRSEFHPIQHQGPWTLYERNGHEN